jgi:hypothetical protein
MSKKKVWKGWTKEQRAKFAATMAARKKAANTAHNTAPVIVSAKPASYVVSREAHQLKIQEAVAALQLGASRVSRVAREITGEVTISDTLMMALEYTAIQLEAAAKKLVE